MAPTICTITMPSVKCCRARDAGFGGVNLFNTTARLCNGSGDHPVFYWRSDDYDSIMSPVCEFIFDRIERYHDGELQRREAVPIQICDRADCGKFLLPERTGRKRYCSDNCRVRAYQMQMHWGSAYADVS